MIIININENVNGNVQYYIRVCFKLINVQYYIKNMFQITFINYADKLLLT